MNGATALDSVKTISAPNKSKTMIIGNNQNFFLTFKNSHISFNRSILLPPKIVFHNVFYPLNPLVHKAPNMFHLLLIISFSIWSFQNRLINRPNRINIKMHTKVWIIWVLDHPTALAIFIHNTTCTQNITGWTTL